MPSERRRDFFENRDFGQDLELGDRPALLIVDMMCGFTNPDYELGADLDAEIPRIQRLRGAARDADVPVIHVYSAFDRSDVEADILWIRKQGGAEDLLAGTDAVAFDERLEPAEDEHTLRKRYASAFFGTDLVGRLNALDADTVVVTGCTTSGCVRATAIDAVQYGYVAVVPAQAVGDRDERAHEQSLFDLEMKYAEVVDIDTGRRYLRNPAEFQR